MEPYLERMTACYWDNAMEIEKLEGGREEKKEIMKLLEDQELGLKSAYEKDIL